MTVGQQNAWDKYWPEMGLTVAENGMLDFNAVFGRSAPVVLEIGFGMGGSLAEMAKADADSNFIGVEVHRPGVGALLMKCAENGSTNLRAFCEDANEVLAKCIPDGSLQRVQLYFPDPWHKKRHHKRRLVQSEFVQNIRKKLAVGGVFHMATDWENYAEHMLEVMMAAEGFENISNDNTYCERPDYRPITKFETRGQRLGHGVWDLLFKRTI